MLTLIVTFIFGFIFACVVIGAWEFRTGLIGGAFFVVVILIPLLSPQRDNFILPKGEHEIQAITDVSVEGDFFIGSGNINGGFVYVCYVKIDHNGYDTYERKIFPADKSLIIERENQEPYVSVVMDTIKSPWLLMPVEYVKKYEIHVPPNHQYYIIDDLEDFD